MRKLVQWIMSRKWIAGILFLLICCMASCGRNTVKEKRLLFKEQLQNSKIERIVVYRCGQQIETKENAILTGCEHIVKHLRRESFSEKELTRAGFMDLTLQCNDGNSYCIAVNGPETKTLVAISQDENESGKVEGDEEPECYTISKSDRKQLEKLYEKIVSQK